MTYKPGKTYNTNYLTHHLVCIKSHQVRWTHANSAANFTKADVQPKHR